MKRPDFFIVGAPKCGTTALYHYLSEHPQVFLPEFKEPHFFAEDLSTPDHICSEQEYLELFLPAGDEHRAVGEGSVWYLFSSTAARRIREFAPEAKVIVMFRSPVEMFVSLHNQMMASLYEEERDPERAWALQEARRRGEHLGELCEEPRVLQYGEVCRLGA
ncbi:MAG: sulfotransferase domain-containing protein, partial [bacterium]|nr:sulfotransferase domain-containing protein [bacterium]